MKSGIGAEKAGLELKKTGLELKKLVNIELVEKHGRKAWDEATGGRLTSMLATGFKSICALLWPDPF